MTKEELLYRIAMQTRREPIQCNCDRCQSQCHTPCLGTPQDILCLIDAGYAESLCYTEWAVGVILGFTSKIIPMVQIKEENGWCVLFHNGKCELHDKGLKPTEGRLSSHYYRPQNLLADYNLTYQVAKTWSDENIGIIREITEKIEKNMYRKESCKGK